MMTMTSALEVESKAAVAELARLVARAVQPNSMFMISPSVWLSNSANPTAPSHAIYHPVLCVVAQGKKQVWLGDASFVYDVDHFLMASVTLPASGQVIEASPERPYLGITIELEPQLIESVIAEAGLSRPVSSGTQCGMESIPMDGLLRESILRLARLFDEPQHSPFLKQLALREIVYRLLTGPQGGRLHQIAAQGGQTHRAVRAIEWLRSNYDKPLSIERLARECGMSVSALHHHFKGITAMSPLQFQKQLRLQEAKRLMVGEGLDAANAGYRVGYDDASYFSREYRRFFGDPPRRHVQRLSQSAS
jgi:AraC-like DNA-binding protein